MLDFSRLKSDELDATLLGLRRQERRLEVQVLHGLIEVERRRLYLDRGYGSLFTYCVERLGYCESSAGRRIAAARTLRRHPRLEGMLLEGKVNLSAVAMAAKAIGEDERVLELLEGKSRRQVEELLAARGHPAERRERLRAVPGPEWEFTFIASPEFLDKFEKARALLSGTHPEGATQEQVFEAALDVFLKRRDPAREVQRSRGGSDGSPRSRAIPRATRRAVWRRDEGRCAFVAPDGRKCGSRWDVEVDHLKPYCRRGPHRIDNLRLLCSAHNRRKAVLDLGTAWMAPFQRRE